MNDKTFNYGKYNGKSHKDVATLDPNYIIHVYENFSDNGGLSNEIYRFAQLVIDDMNSDNDDDWDNPFDDEFVEDDEGEKGR